MADGVAPKDVYKVLATKEGQDRAFKKLDELKPNIQWWEAGAQPPQYLASGDVVMSSAYNGRIAAVQKESNLKVVWNGGIYDFDAWAIPKGAKDAEAAKKFIAFVQPEQQKIYSENIAYGPANSKAVSLLSDEVKKDMPTTPENIANQVQIDVASGLTTASSWSNASTPGRRRSKAGAAAAGPIPCFAEFAMAIAVPLNEGAGPSLKQRLKHAERVNRWKAQALIAPLALFLLLVFLVPIAALLYKSVGNPEVVGGLPRTVEAIASGTARACRREVYKALSQDLAESRKNQTLGDLSKRLNMELAGYRSLLTKTALPVQG
jgi:hypothetical protein